MSKRKPNPYLRVRYPTMPLETAERIEALMTRWEQAKRLGLLRLARLLGRKGFCLLLQAWLVWIQEQKDKRRP